MAEPFTSSSGEQRQNNISLGYKSPPTGAMSEKQYIDSRSVNMGKSTQHENFEAAHARNSDSYTKYTGSQKQSKDRTY